MENKRDQILEKDELIELALDIIENSVNLYFTIKLVGNEILSKTFGYKARGRSRKMDKLEVLKKNMSYRLIPILRKLRDLGYIKKISRKTWKKQKPLDLTPNEFIERTKHIKKRG